MNFKKIVFILITGMYFISCSTESKKIKNSTTLIFNFSETNYSFGDTFNILEIDSVGKWIKKSSFVHNYQIDTILFNHSSEFIGIITKQNKKDSLIIVSPMFFTADEVVCFHLGNIPGDSKVSGRENKLFNETNYSFLNPDSSNKFFRVQQVLELYREIPKSDPVYNDWKMYKENVIRNISKFSDYYYSLFQLSRNLRYFDSSTIEICLKILKHNFETQPLYKQIYFNNKVKNILSYGSNFPDIVVFDNEFKTFKNSELFSHGKKYYIIDFGASWCLPCIKQTKWINENYSKIDTTTTQIISFSLDGDKQEWLFGERRDKKKWNSYLIDRENSINKTVISKIHFVPQYFLLDQNKKIISIAETISELNILPN
jgi:thiol-disulfide isomerase/thioredoxin